MMADAECRAPAPRLAVPKLGVCRPSPEIANQNMRKQRWLNHFPPWAVILFAPFVFCCQTDAQAQAVDALEVEEEIDLDALQEEEGGQLDGESSTEEALLPVNTETPEVRRHPALMLVGVALLVPLAAMLLPATYNRRRRRVDSGPAKKAKSR